MIRYLRQKEKGTCGPVAIINALKWAGIKATEKTHKKKIKQLTSHNMRHGRGFKGCFPYDVNYALSCYKSIYACCNHTGQPNTKLSKIDKHLDYGGSLLIRYFWKPGHGHYTFCIGRTSKTYLLVNDSREKTIIRRSRKTMEKMLSTANYAFGAKEYPIVWFLLTSSSS